MHDRIYEQISFSFDQDSVNTTKMSYDDYIEFTREVAIYPGAGTGNFDEILYLVIEVANESGELAGALKKYIRGDYSYEEFKEKLIPEMGDVMFAFMRLHDALGISPEYLMKKNYDKLLDRKVRGKLQGSGDNR